MKRLLFVLLIMAISPQIANAEFASVLGRVYEHFEKGKEIYEAGKKVAAADDASQGLQTYFHARSTQQSRPLTPQEKYDATLGVIDTGRAASEFMEFTGQMVGDVFGAGRKVLATNAAQDDPDYFFYATQNLNNVDVEKLNQMELTSITMGHRAADVANEVDDFDKRPNWDENRGYFDSLLAQTGQYLSNVGDHAIEKIASLLPPEYVDPDYSDKQQALSDANAAGSGWKLIAMTDSDGNFTDDPCLTLPDDGWQNTILGDVKEEIGPLIEDNKCKFTPPHAVAQDTFAYQVHCVYPPCPHCVDFSTPNPTGAGTPGFVIDINGRIYKVGANKIVSFFAMKETNKPDVSTQMTYGRCQPKDQPQVSK